MNDTRKDARLPVALTTRYREPTMLEPRQGECRDLSLSGMFITTQRPSPRGALIRFECVSDRPDDGFRGTGRVIWQRTKPDERGPAGMGVRFVRLESGGLEALERTIDRVGSERPLRRSPQPSDRAPANARARQEEAMAQAVPIFAAGTVTSSTSTAHAAVQTPLPPAHSTNTARFPQQRSPTLRGVPVQGEVEHVSSRPPAAGSSADNTPLPPPPRSPLPPEPDGAGSTGELRDRLDRTRRGVGPLGPQNNSTAASAPGPAPQRTDSDRTAADVAARTGSDRPAAGTAEAPHSDRPAAGTAEASRSDRPARSAPPSAWQNGTATSNGGERPARERPSDRPPQPGGVDDLRTRAAQSAASSTPPNAEPRPREVAFGRTTMKEVATGPREGAPGRREPQPDVAPAARQLSADAGFPRAERDTTERRIPIASDLARYERGSSPDFERERGSSRWLLWVIASTGLLMSYLIVRMFGGALPGIPGKAVVAEVAPSAAAASTLAASQESHMPYTLAVTTLPSGARVSAAGQSVVAPGELHLDGLQPPLQVLAELVGYDNTTATVWPSQFERNGNAYQGKLELTLQATGNAPRPAAAQAPAAKPSASRAQPAPTKARDPGHTDAPARSTTAAASSARQRNDSPTPSRRASKVAPATVVITPAAPAPPSPEATRAPATDSAPASDSQQTPLAEALDCLTRGDNRCVIRALENKASSAREFELLIETYRAVSSNPRAERQMQSYLERFPQGQRAPEYRRLLERRAANPSTEPAAPLPQTP